MQIQPQSISNNPSSILRNITSVSSGIDSEHIQNKNSIAKNKSNLESTIMNGNDNLNEIDLEDRTAAANRITMRTQVLQGGSGNPKRRFKNNNQ